MKITIIDIPKQRLPEGKHQVTIAKVQPGLNQNGLDFFECTFENANGTFTSRFYTTEKAMYRVVALFRACHLSAEHNEAVDTDDLIGKSLEIENILKERDGNQFVDMVGVYPLPLNAATTDDSDVIESTFEDDGLPF